MPDAPDPDPGRWPAGAATGVGSLPGTDVTEAAATVVGELPLLPHLPELPARGVGADMIGRTAALLVDLAVEVVPSGWRVTARPGRDHRRALDLLRFDVDALDAACAGPRPGWVKVQAAGPWTLAASVELHTGHRVLTDRGAVREFAGSLGEGLRAHVVEVAERTGARVLVQLDEPSLPAVLAGMLPTASGWGTVRSVSAQDAQDLLRDLVAGLEAPVVVHCCAPNPPVRLLAAAGVVGIGIDATLPVFSGPTALSAALDALGEVWDAGIPLLLGLVPAVPPQRTRSAVDSSRATGEASRRESPDADRGSDDPGAPSSLRALARRAFDLADRLGFDRARLAELAVPTPTCGLAGATPEWARRAMTLSRELGQAFVDPPETW
ncbi:MAG: methionine synthase [Pseudonocardia sp.]|nr:methionine synthase [Pseudonocardia sp.]